MLSHHHKPRFLSHRQPTRGRGDRTKRGWRTWDMAALPPPALAAVDRRRAKPRTAEAPATVVGYIHTMGSCKL